MKCTYRAATECRLSEMIEMTCLDVMRQECKLCLMGMLCDEVDMSTRVIMSISMDKLEKEADMLETKCLVKCNPKTYDGRCKECKHNEPHDFSDGCDSLCFFSSTGCEKVKK